MSADGSRWCWRGRCSYWAAQDLIKTKAGIANPGLSVSEAEALQGTIVNGEGAG